jgi:hypothetical protein
VAERLPKLLRFPNPVNEIAARTVAAGVLLMAVLAVALDQPWFLVPLVYGFWARVLTGPTLSPLGQLATRVIVPALKLEPRPTPGPPKRFAQGIGAALCTVAVILWVTAGFAFAEIALGLLVVAAFLESVLGICLGCIIFAALMRRGVIPSSVCEECADISKRHRALREHAAA